MNPNTRAIAIGLLLLWERELLPIDQVLEQHAGLSGVTESRDRQLILALVYGTLRWRGYLDGILSQYSDHPLAKMKPLTLQALRVGLYQLLFLDRIPEAAAVNETVAALRQGKQPKWLTGFVNGLLRNIARNRSKLPDPWQIDEAMPLPARLSHPEWLLKRWQERYGPERAIRLCQANNRQPPLTLRANTQRITRRQLLETLQGEGLTALAASHAPAAVHLPDFKGPVTDLPGYDQGLFQVQDEAGQLVTFLLGPFTAGKHLDGCAGLGGKTTHLAELVPETGTLVAIEPNALRHRRLWENLERQGQSARVTVVRSSLEEYAIMAGLAFDRVLLDAPCSGLGVIRRHPDIRWSRSPEDLGRFQDKQRLLLETAAGLLSVGGILVYATCSTEPEENEQMVAEFLRQHEDFRLTDCREILPASAAPLVDAEGFFRTLPDQGLDGFFAARLERTIGNGKS